MMTVTEQRIALGAHTSEVAAGERFEFGKNWTRFLSGLSDERIAQAENSLRRMLGASDLAGRSFLDAGSGSGLFSLAARRLGARVHSFDYDPHSVACTAELRRRYFPHDPLWTVQTQSVLDSDYLARLGSFDVVYSWGVLHHTGQMWQALENIHRLVRPGGQLFIAIYNDTGSQTARWRLVKRTYNRLPRPLRLPFALAIIAPNEIKDALRSLLTGRVTEYLRSWTQSSTPRGMSRWHDWIDWIGGYPYEVARPEEIFDFYRERGFRLTRLVCGGVGTGCNEFVFVKESRDE